MPSDYRRLIPTECLECVIDVIGWRDDTDPDWPEGGWVNVGLLSVHVALSERSWGGRIRRAWGILRGDSQGCLEFYSRETMEAFIEAMNQALEVSFPRLEGRGDVGAKPGV